MKTVKRARTIEDVLLALPAGSNDKGLTVPELRARTGKSEREVRRRLQELSGAGQLIVGRRMVLRIDGNPTPKPVYRLKGER